MSARARAPSRTVRAVLVDMDDTIFDHSLTCRAAIAALRRKEAFLRRRPLAELWSEYLRLLNDVAPGSPGRARTVDEARRERWRRVARSCGEDLSPTEVAELSRTYRAHYQRLRRAVPGALELLRRIHGRAAVVVVSNNELAEQEEKVRFLGVGPFLDGLVVSEAVGTAKPERRIFDLALSAAGVLPEEATMLGDSWPNDVEGARGAGVRPVWFNRFGLPRPEASPVDELRSLRPSAPAEGLLLGPPPRAPKAGPSSAPRAL